MKARAPNASGFQARSAVDLRALAAARHDGRVFGCPLKFLPPAKLALNPTAFS